MSKNKSNDNADRTTARIDRAAGQRLRAARTTAGLPIAALAARAGCSSATLIAIELHGLRPKVNTRTRIAGALGVAVATIWRGQTNARRIAGGPDAAA